MTLKILSKKLILHVSKKVKEERMDIIDLVKSRRSVRKFKPDPVPDDVVMKLLEAARWAPSWANTQCWEFVVVKDPKIKAELSETLVPPRNPAKSAVANAPVVIAALGRKGVSGFYRGSAVTNKGDWFMFDVALAVQNLVLEAHALGLGTVIVGALDFEKASKILNVPPNVELVALIPVGYPDESPQAPPRKRLSDMVYRDVYGNKMIAGQ
jgi:nitroreductase